MLESLQRLQSMRGIETRDARLWGSVLRVKRWQHLRLAHTYRDLTADTRMGPPTHFFLHELYGDKESAIRDRDLIRMYPTIKRLLPQFAFETVSRALALDVLSEEFDQALARRLRGDAIDCARYAEAFRAAGRQDARLQQVALMREVGEGLDVVVKKPLIYTTLKMLRRPAKMAGLAEMQRFLEAGFTAFRHMKGASPFLRTIAERETALIDALFCGREATLSDALWPRSLVLPQVAA
jgi:hypothetical protein